MGEQLLKVEHLKVYYQAKSKGLLNLEKKHVKAVDDISFTIDRGESLGIVGESGCGKSTTGKAIMQLIQPTAGEVWFKDEKLSGIKRQDRFELSKHMQMIFQDSLKSLDPRFTVGKTILEPLTVHKIGSPAQRKEMVLNLMADVGLKKEHFDKYPHEFSGGQRQRVGVARALALSPSLVVCDEPVSALDVSIQSQILNLMKDLQDQYALTYLFISHNLAVVKHFCDRVAVMYLGHIIELSDKKSLFERPKHPYTKGLIDAIPIPDPTSISMKDLLKGDVPSPLDPPKGCVFHSRCKYALDGCAEKMPALLEIEPEHFAACHRVK